MKNRNPLGVLSGSTLKLIACACMLIDHIGHHLIPGVPILRIIGRIAFPVFAFFIAEGCRYTRNKLRYFLMIFVSGLLFLGGTYLFSGILFYNVFLNFSVAILCVYTLDFFRRTVLGSRRRALTGLFLSLAYVVILSAAYVFFKLVPIEYGFFGMMIPVALSALDVSRYTNASAARYADNLYVRVLLVGVMLLGIHFTGRFSLQIYSLLALPLLLLYNGERGRYKLKYFFYAFYPAHIAVIYGIKFLLSLANG